MKTLLRLALLMGLVATGIAYTTLAGQFVIRTPDTILWQSPQDAILVLHNSTDKLVSQIVLDFPGKVKVERFVTNDGVMGLQQQGTHIVLNGALLENGFVQLRWSPGTIPPLTAMITGETGTRTLTLTDPQNWITLPTEVEEIDNATMPEVLITRAQGDTAHTLTLKFDAPIAHASVLGIGCTPKLVINKNTIVITGEFPIGTTIDLKWEPSTVHLIAGVWNDRSLYMPQQTEGITFNMPFTATATTVKMGEPIVFTAPLTHGVKKYRWNFGDGTTATGAKVSHVFINAGEYIVTLQETEENGEVHLRQRTVDVQSVAMSSEPIANIAPDANPEGPYGPYPLEWEDEQWVSQGEESGYWVDYYGYDVHFDASASYAPQGNITKYEWDFGDGQTAVTNTPYVTHHYEFSFKEQPAYYSLETAVPGTSPANSETIQIPVTLTVTDSQGKTNTSTTYVEFVNPVYEGAPE